MSTGAPKIVRVADAEPPIDLASADEFLNSRLYVLDTGNECVVTPAMRRSGNDQCRILINYAWVRTPTLQEAETMHEYVANVLGMGSPEFLHTSATGDESERVVNDWLTRGKKPGDVS